MKQLPPGFLQMVENDISSIEAVLAQANPSEEALTKLHREIDGKYQSCIQQWSTGMYNWFADFGFSYEYFGIDSAMHNLELMKARLTTYKYQVNAVPSSSPSSNVTVNVDNTINLQVSFEKARTEIKENTYLSETESKEIIEKIDEIEKLVTSNSSKKTKWEKAKPILGWISNKGVDVGIKLLPLLLNIQ